MSDSSSVSRFEVRLTSDGNRLLLITWIVEGKNFWVHDNGTYSWVPTEKDIKTMNKLYEAIDNYNQWTMLKKNIKTQS
jgi:hypothetical protein